MLLTAPPDRIAEILARCDEALRLRSYALNTRRAYLYHIRSFASFACLARDQMRPRWPKTLPGVLGRDEVLRLIRALPNLKHRTILILAYWAGLRVS